MEIARYVRKNRVYDVVIYVRGNNEAMQEIMCKLYAADNHYRVLYVTRHIEDVNNCDILLVANYSRLGRDKLEVAKIKRDLKRKDIKIESVAGKDNSEDIYDMLAPKLIYKSLNTLKKI